MVKGRNLASILEHRKAVFDDLLGKLKGYGAAIEVDPAA